MDELQSYENKRELVLKYLGYNLFDKQQLITSLFNNHQYYIFSLSISKNDKYSFGSEFIRKYHIPQLTHSDFEDKNILHHKT